MLHFLCLFIYARQETFFLSRSLRASETMIGELYIGK